MSPKATINEKIRNRNNGFFKKKKEGHTGVCQGPKRLRKSLNFLI